MANARDEIPPPPAAKRTKSKQVQKSHMSVHQLYICVYVHIYICIQKNIQLCYVLKQGKMLTSIAKIPFTDKKNITTKI